MEVPEKQPSHFSNPGYSPSQPANSPHPSTTTNTQVSIVEAGEGKTRFTTKTRKHYRILSIGQIILGAIAVISQIIVLIWALKIFQCLWHDFFFFFADLEPIPSEGAGIWCGVIFIVAGVVGLKACMDGVHKYWITASMLLNLFCSLLVFALIGLAALNIKDVGDTLCDHHNSLALAFDVIMIIAGCMELIFCVWAVLLACDARYSCFTDSARGQNYNVMYNEGSEGITPRQSSPRAWSAAGDQTTASAPPHPYSTYSTANK